MFPYRDPPVSQPSWSSHAAMEARVTAQQSPASYPSKPVKIVIPLGPGIRSKSRRDWLQKSSLAHWASRS